MTIGTAPIVAVEDLDPRAYLRDGSVAALRVSRPADQSELRRFFHELSPGSRQRRFFSLAEPAETLIDAFCDSSDPTRQATVVALRLEDEGLRLVAVASYLDLGNGVAEAAFAVADTFQGKGLGTILLERLAKLAAANGFRRFNAIVLSDNQTMLDVFRFSGFQIGSKTQHGVVTVALSLSPPPTCAVRTIPPPVEKYVKNRMTPAVLIAFLLVTASAWAQSFAPPGWSDGLKLNEPADLNPDPRIVEVNLTAQLADVEIAPGKRVHAWTYNGGLPGPLIKTRIGDRLIVHFKNELKEPTTVHWHGVRVPIEMDGVPGVSQEEVQQGESFTYDFVVRDAGLYWYHPHVMSAAQVGFGLYGALLVEDPDDGVGVADQVTIVLSDIGFDAKGELEPAESGGSAGMVFGREGEYVLANGRTRPVLRARPGAPQRWRIVNASKSRYFYLDLEGQAMTVIGGDGGLQEREVTTDILLITAGERADVIVTPKGKAGTPLVLRAMLYNRGYGSVEYRSVEEVLAIEFTKEAPVAKTAPVVVRRAIPRYTAAGATPVNIELTLPPVEQMKSEFRVNGVPFWKAKPYVAKLGETQLWIVKNDTVWDHPFHLHGFFFQVVDEKGQPVGPVAWKDTVNIPMKTTARFLVKFDERPGEWMFHCHILDHADGGLMGTVLVGPVSPSTHMHTKKQ